MALADGDSHKRIETSLSDLSFRALSLELLIKHTETLHIRYNHTHVEVCA